MQISTRIFFYLAIDLFLIVVCFINVPTVLERARVPFQVQQVENSIAVISIDHPSAAGELQVGDDILRWEKNDITIPEMLYEYLGDLFPIGKKIDIAFKRGSVIRTTTISLVPFYDSPRFLIVTFCVGFVMWVIGVFVLVYGSNNPAASILHWALIVLAVSVMLTWGRIDSSSLFPLLARTLFFISYTLVSPLFFLFSMKYPRERQSFFSRYPFLIFFPAIVLIIGQTYHHLHAIRFSSVQSFAVFQQWFDIFNIYLFVMVAATMFNLISSYRSAVVADDKRRLEWILWGFCVSPIPFLLFIKFPQVLGISSELIPEEFTTIFFLLIPFSFTVSLVKYNVLDVQLVISRSIVYAALTLFTGTIYALTVLLVATSFDSRTKLTEYLFIGTVILLTGYALNPVRKRLQNFLDEMLFPARINFQRSVTEVREALRKCITPDDVYGVLKEHINNVISFEKLAFYAYSSGTLKLKASKTADHPESIFLTEREIFHIKQMKILDIKNVFSFRDGSNDLIELLKVTECSILFPIVGQSQTLLGIAGVTPSITVRSLSKEEVDLFMSFCIEAGELLDHLLLQEKIILQNKEKERFEELSNLKSYFVSSVSHELRTPLTSIRMFTEMLDSHQKLSLQRRNEYLHIIHGESVRLSRLVDNVLDFAKIERGEKEYRFETIDLSAIVGKSVDIMRYQFEKQKGILKTHIAKKIPPLLGDPDALEEAIINLLSNALKYSRKKIFVRMSIKQLKDYVVLEIADHGIGIPESEIQNIFEKFYRVRKPRQHQSGGTGLGLALVKHIVEAHGGDIQVKSIVGKGSTFTIRLPLKRGSTA